MSARELQQSRTLVESGQSVRWALANLELAFDLREFVKLFLQFAKSPIEIYLHLRARGIHLPTHIVPVAKSELDDWGHGLQ